MHRRYTLCVIHEQRGVLLGLKKRGFKAGYWNGFGGKVKRGETIEQAIRREVKEEAGIRLRKIEKVGVISFKYPDEIMEVHIFLAHDFAGTPTESDEMKPAWFPADKIPYGQMLDDVRYWLPCVLDHISFTGEFRLNNKHQITSHTLITCGY